jgi:hypothetical protein
MRIGQLLGCFDRRALFELIPAGVVFAAVLVGMRFFERGTPGRAVLIVLTAAAVAYVVLVAIASIRRLDELQQRIHLVSMAAGFTVVGMLAVSAELLEKAGIALPSLGVSLWFVMTGVWAIGLFVVGRRYK